MKFRPCIDLHNGKVKQIVGGSLTDNEKGLIENFVSEHDASYYAALYKKDNLTGGHVIKLGPGNEDEALHALQTYPGGLQIGGGIHAENAAHYLEEGARHVIVTSYVFKDGKINFKNLEKILHEVGKEKLVLDLSCREKSGVYYVVTNRWQQFTDYAISRSNLIALAEYCDEFLIHAADVEGKCQGIQEDLLQKLGEWVSIPTTYAGGIRSVEDLELIWKLGKGRIDFTVGSALDIFGGNMPYRAVVQWHHEHS